jgi:replicative DNA helicase
MIVMKCKIISEQTLLASIIFDNTRFAEAHAIIGPDDFSHDLHRIIYEVMLVLDANNDFIDYINLSEKLLRWCCEIHQADRSIISDKSGGQCRWINMHG